MADATRHLQAILPSACPEEVAAVAAALERFVRDTAPPPQPSGQPDAWRRAAIGEGVEREVPAELPDPWLAG